MGYAFCGTDRNGREIGYGIEAACDLPECGKQIDRGLAFACGGEHGDGCYSCEKYFCEDHLECPTWEGMYDGYDDLEFDMCDVVWEIIEEQCRIPVLCPSCRDEFVKMVTEDPELWKIMVDNQVEIMRKHKNGN